MEAAKIQPMQLSRISREDIRNTLHTYFHSLAYKNQQRGAGTTIGGASGAIGGSGGGRRRVYSLIQVEKKKVSLTSKRLFGHGGGSSSAASKYYILCVSVQDGVTGVGAVQMHYLQFLGSNFSVEVRQSWDISKLNAIENYGLSSEKKRGSFALFFEGEDTAWQWLVDDSETKFAMQEFLWSVCALLIEKKKMLPRLVRINIEELSEVAIHLNLQKKYGIDVDLLDHMATMKKTTMLGGNEADPEEDNSTNVTDLQSAKDGGTAIVGTATSMRLTAAENDDTAALLADVNWSDVQLMTIEEDLRKKLRVLEDENITFLLSFEGDSHPYNNNNRGKTPAASHGGAASSTTAVDKIISSIDAVLKHIQLLQHWTNESDEFLDQTSMNMRHFESLNNQLEVHFKNSVALQETLEKMMQTIEIPRENMAVLLKPLELFPDEHQEREREANGSLPAATQQELNTRMKITLATIVRIDEAIKSTNVFPASEMTAFRARGEELSKLAKVFNDKICISFDGFLMQKIKQWMWNSRLAATSGSSSTGAGGSSPNKTKKSSFAREHRDLSSSMRPAVEMSATSRLSRTVTSFEGEIKEMDWTFTNEPFHATIIEYQSLFAHLQSLDVRNIIQLRQVYAKNLASVYNSHVQSLFRCLRDRLPKSTKNHFAKPQSLQSWSFHLSSSFLGEVLGVSPLMQQALDHLVPIVTREQRLVSMLFFPDHRNDKGAGEPEELALMMENIFEKTLKRMNEFGEAAASRNILDALALVVLVNGQLETYRKQSEFLFNVIVSFQLQMKRILTKFTDDQEAWINNHHTDTRMAGVLNPVMKTLIMIGRLEESACGKTDDSTLASIYHRILPATLQWLEKISENKPKYTSLTRLARYVLPWAIENYLYISEKLAAINSSPDMPLAQYAAHARAKYVENLQLYVTYIWEYEFKQLAPMFSTIEGLLKSLPAQEIQYHTPRQEVRRVMENMTATFEKSVKSMHDRMKKHFSANAKVLPNVWTHLVEYGRARLIAYDKMALDCYQLRMEPNPERGVEILRKFSSP